MYDYIRLKLNMMSSDKNKPKGTLRAYVCYKPIDDARSFEYEVPSCARHVTF